MSDTTNAARPGRFRKKPVVIDAIRWSGYELDLPAIFAFIGDFSKLPGVGYVPALGELEIPTLEGRMTARPGDWIIKGVKGEFYPCKPDIFEATYERAESRSAEPTSEAFEKWWNTTSNRYGSRMVGDYKETARIAWFAALAHPEAPKNEDVREALVVAMRKAVRDPAVTEYTLADAALAALAHPGATKNEDAVAAGLRTRVEAWIGAPGSTQRKCVCNVTLEQIALLDEMLSFLAAHPGARAAHAVCENSRDCIACGERIEPAFGVCYSCAVADPKIHAERARAAQTAEGKS